MTITFHDVSEAIRIHLSQQVGKTWRGQMVHTFDSIQRGFNTPPKFDVTLHLEPLPPLYEEAVL